ncbi:hypothetical protein [Exiguobacterium sp. s142]|uniref:hypothetical protein n=1 Tax=Exiguobacterium sp. s142 TaxID=2751222 RepID=UPI001BE6A490|nr:hypothetical protein [Exiguobacterium sp. s142]
MNTVYSFLQDIKKDLQLENIEFLTLALLLFLFIFLFNNVSKQIETRNALNRQEIKEQLNALSTLKTLVRKEERSLLSDAIHTSIDKLHPSIARKFLYYLAQKENPEFRNEIENTIDTEIDRLLKLNGGNYSPDSIGGDVHQIQKVIINIMTPFTIASGLLIAILYFTYLMILLISLDLSFIELMSIMIQICYLIMFCIISFHWVKRRIESKNTKWDKGFKLFVLGIGIFGVIYYLGFTYPKPIIVLIGAYVLILFNFKSNTYNSTPLSS